MGVGILLLDDGFQYWKLRRDQDIILIDATNPFGYGHGLPRGLLREPLDALSRASLFILTKSDQVHLTDLMEIREELARLAPGVPVLSSHMRRRRWCRMRSGEPSVMKGRSKTSG